MKSVVLQLRIQVLHLPSWSFQEIDKMAWSSDGNGVAISMSFFENNERLDSLNELKNPLEVQVYYLEMYNDEHEEEVKRLLDNKGSNYVMYKDSVQSECLSKEIKRIGNNGKVF